METCGYPTHEICQQNANMGFGIFYILIIMLGTRDDEAGLISHTKKSDFLPLWCQLHASQTDSLFPSFVEFQYSLFHPICRFVGFPVLVHALTHMEQTRLFAVLCPHEIFSFVDADGNPAVQAVCEYSTGFRY
jgi:hypothetical protein